jgi:hypothetical protein
LLAWEILLPNCGPLPQRSHLAAMVLLQSFGSQRLSADPLDSGPQSTPHRDESQDEMPKNGVLVTAVAPAL